MARCSKLLFLTAGLLATAPGFAQELKPICPDRGAFQPCTVDAHHVQVELGLVDWFDDQDSTLLIADTVIRLGLDNTTEVQLGVSPWLKKSQARGQGDLRFALRKRLLDSKFSLAVQPTLIVPTGSKKLSNKLLIPGVAIATTYDLTPRTQFYFTPYAVKGQHFLGGTFLGVNQTLYGPIGASMELAFQHQKGETQSSIDFTATYSVGSRLEFDTSANIGITFRTPALELVLGVTRRF